MTEPSHTPQNSTGDTVPARAQFIPILKSDLISALSDSGIAREHLGDFTTLCAFLSAYFHHDFYDELTDLKEVYSWFSPAGPRPQRREPPGAEEAFASLSATLVSVMTRANFVELAAADVTHLAGEHPLLDVKTRTPMENYESIRIFVRGTHTEIVAQKSALGFKGQNIPLESYDDVVIFVRFKQKDTVKQKRLALRRLRDLPGGAQPGSILIKSFRNISRLELPMLLPDVQVVMSRKDAFLLGGPALLGGIPIALNILPALSVVLVVIGAYLGFAGQVTQDKLTKAVAALSVIVGAGLFMFRQYSNYSFRKLKYQKRIADNIYFKNVNNDAGVFETLIGSAEEQEVKEVILAYHALLTGGPAHAGELDERIEAWLKANFARDIDFEVADALEKLEGLGFLASKDGKNAAVPLSEALTRLDTLWDQLYDFKHKPSDSVAA
jgi:hypothetical protein